MLQRVVMVVMLLLGAACAAQPVTPEPVESAPQFVVRHSQRDPYIQVVEGPGVCLVQVWDLPSVIAPMATCEAYRPK